VDDATRVVSPVTLPATAPTQEWVVEPAVLLVVGLAEASEEALLAAHALPPATSAEGQTTLRAIARLRR
jgi:hypothetical protein